MRNRDMLGKVDGPTVQWRSKFRIQRDLDQITIYFLCSIALIEWKEH